MPTSLSFNLTFSFYFFLILLNFSHPTHQQQQQQTPPPFDNLNNTLTTAKSPPPFQKPSSSFKPVGVTVVVGVLTTMFSLIFLLFLYIKHCNTVSNHNNVSSYNSTATTTSRGGVTGRKNSGVDLSVIESLPIFRFGSLMGQKEGLDCAVCLTKFEATEVLRLLPKCKHAFHVECVDTWLDAHSTCPLCRYRVDPEDIFLLHDSTKISHRNQNEEHVIELEKGTNSSSQIAEVAQTRRISGRHSSVESGVLKIIKESKTASFFRRSLDSATAGKKNENGVVGCFVRQRKDEMLMLTEMERRLEHRIIMSPPPPPPSQSLRSGDERWSDVEALDLLYLTSEMIMSGGGRRMMVKKQGTNINDDGRGEINTRSVSEITGMTRFLRNNNNNNNNTEGGRQRHQQQQQRSREEGLVSRWWLAWISISRSQHSQTLPDVR